MIRPTNEVHNRTSQTAGIEETARCAVPAKHKDNRRRRRWVLTRGGVFVIHFENLMLQPNARVSRKGMAVPSINACKTSRR